MCAKETHFFAHKKLKYPRGHDANRSRVLRSEMPVYANLGGSDTMLVRMKRSLLFYYHKAPVDEHQPHALPRDR